MCCKRCCVEVSTITNLPSAIDHQRSTVRPAQLSIAVRAAGLLYSTAPYRVDDEAKHACQGLRLARLNRARCVCEVCRRHRSDDDLSRDLPRLPVSTWTTHPRTSCLPVAQRQVSGEQCPRAGDLSMRTPVDGARVSSESRRGRRQPVSAVVHCRTAHGTAALPRRTDRRREPPKSTDRRREPP